jgi:hypothetical protein
MFAPPIVLGPERLLFAEHAQAVAGLGPRRLATDALDDVKAEVRDARAAWDAARRTLQLRDTTPVTHRHDRTVRKQGCGGQRRKRPLHTASGGTARLRPVSPRKPPRVRQHRILVHTWSANLRISP